MGYEAINRRQFLVRGGAAAMAVGLFAQLPAAARAAGALSATQAEAALSVSELDVVGGLVSAICVANGRSLSDAGALGLLGPAEFASAYAACDAETRAAISAVLAAIEHGPAAALFSLLGSRGQADFVGEIFGELELYEASSHDIAVLDALADSTNALVASLHPALGSGAAPAQPAFAIPHGEPLTGASNGRYLFSQTLLCGLTLVSEPLFGDPETIELPQLSSGTVAALAQWLEHRSVGSRPPGHLVSAITSELAGPLPAELEHRVYPCVALSRALTLWLGLDLERNGL